MNAMNVILNHGSMTPFFSGSACTHRIGCVREWRILVVLAQTAQHASQWQTLSRDGIGVDEKWHERFYSVNVCNVGGWNHEVCLPKIRWA